MKSYFKTNSSIYFMPYTIINNMKIKMNKI